MHVIPDLTRAFLCCGVQDGMYRPIMLAIDWGRTAKSRQKQLDKEAKDKQRADKERDKAVKSGRYSFSATAQAASEEDIAIKSTMQQISALHGPRGPGISWLGPLPRSLTARRRPV